MEFTSPYIAARRVLLDAVEALGSQAESAILVGAQAIYLRCGGGGVAVAPMTTDADLALDVDRIEDEPEIFTAMEKAGFVSGGQPGSWMGAGGVAVDLMTVPHQSNRLGKTARSADIPPHRRGIARITRGLEAAIVDHEPMRIESLAPEADRRAYRLAVAGPAALLVAKLIKLGERVGQGNSGRIHPKDALDVLRILRAARFGTLVAGLRSHRSSEYAKSVSEEAMAYLAAHGRGPGAPFAQLAAEAVGGDPVTGASFAALADRLLAALDS